MGGTVLGIIGGGQLGMMLVEAASRSLRGRISRVVVLDPTEGCPAAAAGAEQIVAGYRDGAAIRELASECDVITYEIESGDSAALRSVQGSAAVSPSPDTLRTVQDKLLQKSFLRGRGLPVGDFAPVGSRAELDEALGRFGLPAVLKARRDAYDGRGNLVIRDRSGAGEALRRFGGRPVYLERFVEFAMEVSVITARGVGGRVAAYPAVENEHEGGVLRTTVAPARLPPGAAAEAGRVARRAVEALGGAGVFGVEMFAVRGGGMLINEIAPRVHNSGHHTLHSSETSQFEQHLRAVLGMDLGGTALLRRAAMCNILGPEGLDGPYRAAEPPLGPGAHLKMYGKKESRPLRKMGHVTVLGGPPGGGTGAGEAAALARRAAALRDAVLLEPAAPRFIRDPAGGRP